MNVIKLLLLTVALTACGTGPEARGIKLHDCKGDSECDPYESVIGVINQTKAMFTAQYMIEDAYDVDYGDLFNKGTTVYWADTICPKDGQYKVIYKNQCNYGRMWSCNEMYVALSNGNPERTCGSALLHEFGHCMYMEGIDPNHSGCPDHSDNAFWAVIEEAQEISCTRDW